MSDHWKSIGKILGTPEIPDSQPEVASEEQAASKPSLPTPEAPELVPVSRNDDNEQPVAEAAPEPNEIEIDWNLDRQQEEKISEVLGLEATSTEAEEPEASNEQEPSAWDNLTSSLGIQGETSEQPEIALDIPRRNETSERKPRSQKRKSGFGDGLGIDLGPGEEEPEEAPVEKPVAKRQTKRVVEEEIFDEVEVIEDGDFAEETAKTKEEDDILGFRSFNDAPEAEPEPEVKPAQETAESPTDPEEDEDSDRPKRRRGRRGGRRRGRGNRDAEGESKETKPDDAPSESVSEFDDDHEDDEEAIAMRRGSRRRRRGRRENEPEAKTESSDRETREPREPRGRPRRRNRDEAATTDDHDEAPSRTRDIPSWIETVDLLVEPNLDNRNKKSAPKGRGGRGRSRRRKED